MCVISLLGYDDIVYLNGSYPYWGMFMFNTTRETKDLPRLARSLLILIG